jgi:L-malate glycosyltransferase
MPSVTPARRRAAEPDVDDAHAQDAGRVPPAPRPVRVLLACDHLDYEGKLHGAGRNMVEMAVGFDPARVAVTAVVLRAASDIGREFQREGVPLTFLGHGALDPRTIWSFVRLIRRHRIDVLHLTDYGASTFGRIAGLLTGTPTIVHVRSHHSKHQRKSFPPHVRLAYQALAPRTARAVAISESIRRFAVESMGFRDDQVETLNNPLARFSIAPASDDRVLALRREYELDAATPVVGCVTRFFPSKGITYLIDAFATVVRSVPAARLLLVGDGPEEPALRAQARRLGVEDRVIFAGFRRDVAAHLRLFWVSAVPSIEEGFGNVGVEALAAGLPVVASRVGGLPEIVTDGVTGYLVEPANAAELAAALERLLLDPAGRLAFGRAAAADSERFRMDRFLARLEGIYRAAAALPARG